MDSNSERVQKTLMLHSQTMRKPQMRPAEPPLRRPGAKLISVPSQVMRTAQLKPTVERKPKLRCEQRDKSAGVAWELS